jgi:molybdate transport system ATP-binding protein
LLSIESVSQRLGDFELDVSLDVPSQGCLALVGPSGSGKSSLLRCVAGLARPDTGRIQCGDELWFDSEQKSFVAPDQRRVGYLFQDYALFPHLNAWRNVAYGLRGPLADRRTQAHELLDRFGLADRAEAKPRTLSGGERQRVALARALAVQPSALLLDEPLSALDASTRGHAARELSDAVVTAGVPTLLVTHDYTEAATLATEIGVIGSGRIVQRGSAADLAQSPGSVFVADLVGSIVLAGRALAPDDAGTPVELDSGAIIWTTEACGPGEVSVSIHPWEILIEPPASQAAGSARNRVPARVVSLTPLGSRVRVGLAAGVGSGDRPRSQPALAAEVTPQAISELGLAPGQEVLAVWKASATKVVER